MESVKVTLYGKRGFADMIKFRILRWGDNPGLSGWPLYVITSFLRRGREGRLGYSQSGEGPMIEAEGGRSESEREDTGFEDGGRGHEPRNAAVEVGKDKSRGPP